MRPYENEVNGFVGEIWSSMLGLAVYPDDEAVALALQDDAIVSRVGITGNWRGTVSLHCDPSLAKDIASTMFGSDLESTSIDMIEDALGELTNITSGGFKTLLPEPCFLSLPSAGWPGGAGLDNVESANPGHFGFTCLDRAFVITIDGSLVMVDTVPA